MQNVIEVLAFNIQLIMSYKMKIITIRKRGKRIYFKFLRIPFCVKIVNKYNTKYKKYYFGGIIKAFRVFRPLEYTMEHNIYFFNHKLFTVLEHDNVRFYYFKQFLYRKLNLKDIIKRLYFKVIKNYDNVFILNANSGETYLFLMYAFDATCKKYNAKKPLLIATKKYHIELIKMICPDIPYIFMKKFYQNIIGDTFQIKNVNLIKVFSQEHFYNVERDIKKDTNAHYYYSILNTLGINPNHIIPRSIQPPAESIISMTNKINKINLDINNFVFLSPEAASCVLLDINFWVAIIKKFNELGVDVFLNLVTSKYNFNQFKDIYYKTCFLTYSEAFALAKHAKKIYALRSGFTEFLLKTNVPMEVYYTPFRCNNITAEQIHSGFGLKQIPETNMKLIEEKVFNDGYMQD